jgi:coenzyme F420-0:L-glutamate ligase
LCDKFNSAPSTDQVVVRIQIIPVKCRVKKKRFDIALEIIEDLKRNNIGLKDMDILVVSSKFAAISQGRIADLSKVEVGPRAKRLSRIYHVQPTLAQLVMDESDSIIGGIPGYLLAMSKGILAPNAGLDLSNAPLGFAVLMPSNSERLALKIRQQILSHNSDLSNIGVILSDSRVTPTRLGTVGIAIASSGIKKTIDMRGSSDLFGKELKVTLRAIADQIATAAEIVMGEANEAVPVVVIRGIKDIFEKPKTDFEKTSVISEDKCLIISGLRNSRPKS